MAGGLFPASLLLSGSALLLFDEMVQWKQRHEIHPDFSVSVSLFVCEMESCVLFYNKTVLSAQDFPLIIKIPSIQAQVS